MTNKQAMRGLSVEAHFYLAECCNCGEVMPSSKLIESRNHMDGDADCYCPHCNADDCDIADMGSAASEAWNYQQKRIEALLDELEAMKRANAAQDDHINQQQNRIDQLEKGHSEAAKQINSWRKLAKQNIAEREKDLSELDLARKRVAELERGSKVIKCWSCQKSVTVDQVKAEDGYCPFCDCGIDLEEYETAELVAAGIITRIEG